MSNYLDNLDLFDEKIISAGRSYYKNKKVQLKEINPAKAHALVFGVSPFEVKLNFDPDHDLISATCSCSSGGFCEHMVATLYECSDYFASHDMANQESDSEDNTLALSASLEDISRAIYRYNYKGLSKNMETFTSLLLKVGGEGRVKGVKSFLTMMFSGNKSTVDYDRLTPYIREIIKKASLSEESLRRLFREALDQFSRNEQFWVTFLCDMDQSILFQTIACEALEEGVEPPYYLASFAPVPTWARILPEFLEKLFQDGNFFCSSEEIISVLNKARIRQDLDELYKLFGIAVEFFPGIDIPLPIREALLEKEEYKKSMEAIFFKALVSDFTPEKYLLWRSVAEKEDVTSRIGQILQNNPKAKIDFIYLLEGREGVGDYYDRLKVSEIPFPLLNQKLERVNEEKVIQELLEYAEDQRSRIENNYRKHIDSLLSLMDVYAHFDLEKLRELFLDEDIRILSTHNPSLRAKMLVLAKTKGLTSLLGVEEYGRK